MIVCLGWGSLIWNPDGLPIKGAWREDGPTLPVEFARMSRDLRLTLVLTPGAAAVPVLWAEMTSPTIGDAVAALAYREGVKGKSSSERNIGRWPAPLGNSYIGMTEIEAWAEVRRCDGVVWTALSPRFPKDGHVPTDREAVTYLQGLRGKARTVAEEYVRKTPSQVRTANRKAIEKGLGWTFDAAFGASENFRPTDRLKYQLLSFQAATNFRTAYDCLADFDDERDSDPTFTASVTCLALSLELHLKTLKCVLEGEHPQHHKISALFGSLPTAIKDRCFADLPNWTPPDTRERFLDRLKGLDDAFVKWRYAPETLETGATMSFQLSFVTSLIHEISAILAEHGYKKPDAPH
jgi:hypothetical protein